MMNNKQPTEQEIEEMRLKIDEKMDSLGRKIVKSGLHKVKEFQTIKI